MYASGESGKQEPFKGRLLSFFPLFFLQTQFVLVEMSYDSKMEIFNGLIFFCIPDLGFGCQCSFMDVFHFRWERPSLFIVRYTL